MEGNHALRVHHRKRNADDQADSHRDPQGVEINLLLELIQLQSAQTRSS